MIQNKETLQIRYEQFVRKVVQTQAVFTLVTEQGVAFCPSNEYDTPDAEPAAVLTYWSERAKAKACQIQEWESYEIKQIPLAEFLEAWCIGMAEDGTLAGVDFDTQLFGIEALPVDLLKDLIHEITQQDVKIKFQHFQSVEDILSYIEEVENIE